MLPKPRQDLVPNTAEFERLPFVKQTGFREYDARWRYPEEINLLGLQAVGLGLATLMRARGVPIRTGRPLLMLSRGLVGFASMGLYFYGLTHLELADAVMLGGTAPIWVALLAPFTLKEKMRARVSYDLDYLRNWSLGLDLKIILKTVLVVLKRQETAY